MKVFIAWSGPRSKSVALALRDWLKLVIQALDPWMSEADVAKGKRWSSEIAARLDASSVAIICVLPENNTAPWLLFETGAAASKLPGGGRVCPFLLDIEPTDLQGPLTEFQMTTAEKDETLRMLRSINEALCADKLDDDVLVGSFETYWGRLEKDLADIKKTKPPDAPDISRSGPEMLKEILTHVREISRGSSDKPARHLRGTGNLGWVINQLKTRGPRLSVDELAHIAAPALDLPATDFDRLLDLFDSDQPQFDGRRLRVGDRTEPFENKRLSMAVEAVLATISARK